MCRMGAPAFSQRLRIATLITRSRSRNFPASPVPRLRRASTALAATIAPGTARSGPGHDGESRAMKNVNPSGIAHQ